MNPQLCLLPLLLLRLRLRLRLRIRLRLEISVWCFVMRKNYSNRPCLSDALFKGIWEAR